MNKLKMAKDMMGNLETANIPDEVAGMVPGIDKGEVDTQKTVSPEEFSKDLTKLLDEDNDIQTMLKGLYSDLEKAFYNVIIKDKDNNMMYNKSKDFTYATCIHDESPYLTFSKKFYTDLINKMCENAMTEEYKMSIINLITNGINVSLYNQGFPYRLMYFDNGDLIQSEYDTLTHSQKETINDKEIYKRYGGIINISTKDI
jgi:hypothetical protein